MDENMWRGLGRWVGEGIELKALKIGESHDYGVVGELVGFTFRLVVKRVGDTEYVANEIHPFELDHEGLRDLPQSRWRMFGGSTGFSERTIAALVAASIDVPERLLFATEEEIGKIPGIGKVSRQEIARYRARCLPKQLPRA